MKNVLLLGWFLSSCFCSAQLTFGEHIISDDSILPKGVTHVELADIDGDGDMDMITASEDDNKIAWFENRDGLGNFGEQNVISLEVQEAKWVRAGDLDGDGDVDLIGVAHQTSNLMGFINDGNGSFTTTVLIETSSQEFIVPSNVLPADVDSDGRLDLVVLSAFGELWYYRNFNNQLSYTRSLISDVFNTEYDNFDIGDIDNDGDIDIVSLGEDLYTLEWHEYINGIFISQKLDVGGINDLMKLVDIDSDNDLDLVLVTSFAQSEVKWIEFDDGYNSDIENIILDSIEGVTSIEIVDVNQNGSPNLVINSILDNNVIWLENITNNEMIVFNYIENASVFSSSLLMKDFNGDSYPDLITSKLERFVFQPEVNSFLSNGLFETFTDEATDLVSFDVDDDGDLDIVSSSNRDGRIGWFENVDGLGTYDKEQNLITNNVRGVTDIALNDIDGDNDLDIVGVMYFENTVFWIKNEGAASFSDSIIIDKNVVRPNSIDLGDVNGDGSIDIVIAANGFGSIENSKVVNWYSNENGLGQFSDAMMVLENVYIPGIVKLGDIDMDQDLDIVCSLGDGGVRWIENFDGMGNFASPILISEEGVSLNRLEIGDIDNDGDVDILASGYIDTPTFLYLNQDGQGVFNDGLTVIESGGTSMKMSDLDQDGDKDIIATRSTNFFMDVVWYEQVNNGLSFIPHIISHSPVLDGNNVDVADLDGDGDLDVMSASITDDKIAWYENYDPVSTNNIQAFNFNIYPVPASSHLRIDSEKILKQVMIFDIEGKLLLVSKDVTNLDILDLASGIYIIQVKNGEDETSSLKFIKE